MAAADAAAMAVVPTLRGPTKVELEEGLRLLLDFEKLRKVAQSGEAVLPVAVQDADSLEVLIVAFANRTALAETLRRKVCVLWSTSRNELWIKGATSGDFLDLVEVRCNCEQNSLLYLVRPRRTGACHTKGPSGKTRPSCYYRRLVCMSGGDEGAGTGGGGGELAALEHLGAAAEAAAGPAVAAVAAGGRTVGRVCPSCSSAPGPDAAGGGGTGDSA
uniref:phosphoribosyl-AMP cyclohydrolase n=1 Tax=Pyrodinium bahamense TaxID=73915 RepID=A0A7S0BDI5_9DINO